MAEYDWSGYVEAIEAENASLEAEVARLRALLERVEWSGEDGYCAGNATLCPFCQAGIAHEMQWNQAGWCVRERTFGRHNDDCPLALALGRHEYDRATEHAPPDGDTTVATSHTTPART